MAYSVGNTIIDDDYNIFATGNAAGSGNNGVRNINTIWGAGTTTYGYGQGTTVAAVSAGSTITATQWATLLTRMTSIANHQGTSITAISNPSAGATISAYTALDSNITTLFGTSRLRAAGSGADSSDTNSTTATWAATASLVKTFTWSSVDTMRYFFNSGGMLRFSWSRSGGTSSPQNTSWTNLLSAAGTITLTSDATSKVIAGVTYTGTNKIGGSGSPSTLRTDIGEQQLSTSNQTLFAQTGSTYLYTSNTINMLANTNSNVLTVTTNLADAASPAGGDVVNGTLSQVSTVRYPSTTYIANTWGTVTRNAPSWTTS